MHHVYKNINEYNPDPENKALIVFDDMIADMTKNLFNRLLEVESQIFLLFLLRNHIVRFQKMLD